MEKVPGIELERVWPEMSIEDRFTVVKAIAGFQKSWTSISFKQYRSLYYSKDLPGAVVDGPLYIDANGSETTDSAFVIGPSTGREMIDNKRDTVDFDRGPCEYKRDTLHCID